VIRFVLVVLLLLLLAWAFWRVVDGIIEALGGTTRRRTGPPPVKLVRDPVCGTWIPPSDSLSLAAKGTTHYFCSDECRVKFRGRV
jgi:uncharacterized protein